MKFLFIFFALLGSLEGISQQLSGHVLDSITGKGVKNCNVFLTVALVDFDFEKTNAETKKNLCWYQGLYFLKVSKTATDSDGKYDFDKMQPGTYEVIAEYAMPLRSDGISSTRSSIRNNVTVGDQKSIVESIYLLVTCPYDKTRTFTHCPKCKRADTIIPIVFGLLNYDENGKSPYGDRRVHNPSCEKDLYCNPTKYCEDCDLEF